MFPDSKPWFMCSFSQYDSRYADEQYRLFMIPLAEVRKTFITSSPRWLMTLTAMRPEAGRSEGAGGVAVQGFPGVAVDLRLEGRLGPVEPEIRMTSTLIGQFLNAVYFRLERTADSVQEVVERPVARPFPGRHRPRSANVRGRQSTPQLARCRHQSRPVRASSRVPASAQNDRTVALARGSVMREARKCAIRSSPVPARLCKS